MAAATYVARVGAAREGAAGPTAHAQCPSRGAPPPPHFSPRRFHGNRCGAAVRALAYGFSIIFFFHKTGIGRLGKRLRQSARDKMAGDTAFPAASLRGRPAHAPPRLRLPGTKWPPRLLWRCRRREGKHGAGGGGGSLARPGALTEPWAERISRESGAAAIEENSNGGGVGSGSAALGTGGAGAAPGEYRGGGTVLPPLGSWAAGKVLLSDWPALGRAGGLRRTDWRRWRGGGGTSPEATRVLIGFLRGDARPRRC